MKKEEVINEINVSGKVFYVYGLICFNEKPFYIGMGQKYRLFDHEYGVKNEVNTLKKEMLLENLSIESLSYEIYSFFDNRPDTIKLEKELIKYYGRLDINTGILTNRSSGGEYPTEFSDETKAKLSTIKTNFYKDNPDALINRSIYVKQWIKDNPEKFNLMQKLATEAKQLPENREKHRISQLEYIKNNPDEFQKTINKTHITRRTPAARKRNSDAQIKYHKQPGSKEKNSASQLKWRSERPEDAKHMQELSTIGKRTPEARKKNSESRSIYIKNNPDKEKQRLEKMKQTMLDPEYRERNKQKQIIAHKKRHDVIDRCKQIIKDNNINEVLPDGRKGIKIFKEFEMHLLSLI